jgi:hypothetical protein
MWKAPFKILEFSVIIWKLFVSLTMGTLETRRGSEDLHFAFIKKSASDVA